jgi:16S rRNA (guanine527-N7)-methyltransferase
MFHVKHEGWGASHLSPVQLGQLSRYEDLLRSRAIPLGMVASSDADHLRVRHIVDSLRVAPHIPARMTPLCDLGSGAGLPGIPIAVARPDLEVTLIEPRRNRAAFLELAVERLAIGNAVVFPGPAEALGPSFEICMARGFADAETTWETGRRLLRPTGEVFYWAGATFMPGDAPAGVLVRTLEDASLESGGPIVIMSRQ